jgi:hypothetical protein
MPTNITAGFKRDEATAERTERVALRQKER